MLIKSNRLLPSKRRLSLSFIQEHLVCKGACMEAGAQIHRALSHPSRLWQHIISARPTHLSQTMRNSQYITFLIALHPLAKWWPTLPWLNGHPTRRRPRGQQWMGRRLNHLTCRVRCWWCFWNKIEVRWYYLVAVLSNNPFECANQSFRNFKDLKITPRKRILLMSCYVFCKV